ncbi:MAG: VCBS repeat-containing protein, partial [Deltaproteobacteria bacterium]|nr:VCBS repeat-containing protein [Deltaproteobacteria bacterium]
RRLVPLFVLGAVMACRAEEEPEPVGTAMDLSEVVRHEATPAIGTAPAAALVRAVNAWGVAVPSDPIDVQVRGADQQVTFDAHGYGLAVLETAGSGLVYIADGESAMMHATARPWPGFGMQRASHGLAQVSEVVPASGGGLVSSSDEVWWVGLDGTAHRVLQVPEGVITGIRSGHLDQDGVMDAVVWAGDALVLLRGRAGGGMSWGGAVRADEMSPAAVGIGDTNADGFPDVAVAWAEPTEAALEVWEGRGGWAFEPAPPVDLAHLPLAIAIGDAAGHTTPQITLTRDDGEWVRFIHEPGGGYALTGPVDRVLALNLPEGTTVDAEGDYNGDGADEIFLLGPRREGTAREIQIWDLYGTQYLYLRYTPMGAYVDLEDANDDGLVDLWMLDEDNGLALRTWADGQSTVRNILNTPTSAPFAVRDQTGDGVPELLLASRDRFTWWPGTLVAGEDTDWWQLDEPEVVAEELDLTGPIGLVELDGDSDTVEVVGFHQDTGSTEVRAYAVEMGAIPTVTLLDGVEVSSTGAAPLDLAVCDDGIFALTVDTLTQVLWSGGMLTTPEQRDLDADRVDCGTGPLGSDLAVLVGDTVQLRAAADLGWIGQETHAGAQDVALVELGGTPQVVTCDTTACSIIRWEYGSGGEQVAVSSDGSVISVNDGMTVSLLEGGGLLSVFDVDGDGTQDLLAQEGGAVSVYRSSGEGFGVAESFHTSRTIAASPAAADVTGDGAGDLIWLDDTGTLLLTTTPE